MRNFGKFLRTPFLQNTSGRLLPDVIKVNDNKTFWKTVKPRFSNKCKVANTQKSRPEVLCKKGVLGNFTKASNFIKKETLARVFSCEFVKFPRMSFS